MLTDITITSTTDTPEQIQAALGTTPPPVEPEVVAPPVEPPAVAPAPDAAPVVPPAAADDDDDADDEDDDAPDPAVSEAARTLGERGRGAKARIGKLRAKLAESERREEELRRTIEAQKPTPAPEPAPAVVEPPVAAPVAFDKARPVQSEFEDFDAFTTALADWLAERADFAADQKIAAAEARRQKADADAREKTERDAELKRQQDAYDARLAVAKERHADYAEVYEAAKDLSISEIMRDHMRLSDQGPELIYYFAQHPDEAAAIAKLHPMPALVALGRIEAAIESAAKAPAVPPSTPPPVAPPVPAAAPVPVSTAPAPLQRVGGTVTPQEKRPDEMNHEEYKSWRKGGGGKS